MKYNIEDIIKLGPCKDYHRSRLKELAAGRESVTASEIAMLGIPAKDRLQGVDAGHIIQLRVPDIENA